MKKLIVLLLLFAVTLNVHSNSASEAEKPFSIGIGSYFNTIAYDNIILTDDGFSGGTLSFAYVVTDQTALRINFFSMEHESFPGLESQGYDLSGFIGVGKATQGLKGYVGGGYFSEE